MPSLLASMKDVPTILVRTRTRSLQEDFAPTITMTLHTHGGENGANVRTQTPDAANCQVHLLEVSATNAHKTHCLVCLLCTDVTKEFDTTRSM